MKIKHFTTDEKFINGAMATFEMAFPGQNELILLKPPSNPKTCYVDEKYVTKEIVKEKGILDRFENISQDADWIILHGLFEVWADFIIQNKDNNILYIIWGAEVYENPLVYKESLFGDLTKKRLKKVQQKIDPMTRLRKKVYSWRYGKSLSDREKHLLKKKALQRIENIAILYAEEVTFYKEKQIIPKNANFVKFGYYPVEYFSKNIELSKKLGSSILIGNSSSYTNNHLEVFKKLKLLNVDNQLVVPLSYGDPQLRKHLVNKGENMFGAQFEPIIEFLPLDAYTKLTQSCGVVIMNHYRQQAVGNIISSVYLGAKVFLNPENTIFHYLKNLGCHVYSIEDELNSAQDLSNLTKTQIEQNRHCLENDISQKHLVKNLKNALEN